MGEEYVAAVRRGCLEERWVDVIPNQGKIGGAFSSGSPGTHPFIMMSYTDEMFSLSTLAHELGHSMHSYLTWQNQPVVYSDYSHVRRRGGLELPPGDGAGAPARHRDRPGASRSR